MHIKITENNIQAIKNTPYVANVNRIVYDLGDVFTEDEENSLMALGRTLRVNIGMDVVIYTMNNPGAYSSESEDYLAMDFYDYNDFGVAYGKQYDGVMLVINKLDDSYYPHNLYYNIISFGNAQFYYGDTRADNMLDYLETRFDNDMYYDASKEFLNQVRMKYEAGKFAGSEEFYLDDTGRLVRRIEAPFFMFLLVSCGISGIITAIFVAKNKMVKKASNATQYIDVNDKSFSRRDDIFRTSRTSSYVIPKSTGGSSGGGSSRGSFRGSSGRSASRGSGRRR